MLDGELGKRIEIESAPDVAIEIVSRATQRKDTEIVPRFYFEAGVKEYWMIDVRWHKVQLDLFRRGAKGFVKTPRRNGKLRSNVFGRSFQMTRKVDSLGHPKFTLSAS